MDAATRALFQALARDADGSEVAALLAAGADPNARDDTGKPALFCTDGGAVLRALLAQGGDVHATWDLGPRGPLPSDHLIPAQYRPAPEAHTILTLADQPLEPETIRLMVSQGFDPLAFDPATDPSDLAIATGADLIPPAPLTADDLRRHGTARAGTANPESFLPPFWREQIRTFRSGYAAQAALLGQREEVCGGAPVWSFDRFGRTATRLPDGRLVLIAGEHEDHYDPDFCIYADVTVLDSTGGVTHYIYPREIFPPTDFHTATLLSDHILLIGSLGYPHDRREGETQVLRLNLSDFSIEPLTTKGDAPGWIHGHEARLDGTRIVITGGKTEPGFRDSQSAFALDLATLTWTREPGS